MYGSYISTFDDFKAAQALHLKHNIGARSRYWGWMIGLPAFTLLLALATWHESTLPSTSGFGLAAWLTFCSAVATIRVVLLRPWNLRRCFRKARKLSGLNTDVPTKITFDHDGITSGIPGRSEGRFFWTAFHGFAEDSRLVLLYISPKRFLFIPKRAMDEEHWQALRQAAQARGLQPHAY
jgi:hypothetical protein